MQYSILDDLLGFLLILLTHPEVTKIKRVSKETLRSRIFTFIGANTDITDFVAQKPSDLKQPFLAVVGSLEYPSHFFLVIDNIVIDCGSNCLHAFNVLFCSFYVFCLRFPEHLSAFYNFFAEAFFNVKTLSPINRAFRGDILNASASNDASDC